MTITMSVLGMREQADRERAIASTTKMPLVRERALVAAETWDRMAEVAERVAAGRRRAPLAGI